MHKLNVNKIYQGHAIDVLRMFPDESIDCVITSPPYYSQRNYNTNATLWDGDVDCEHEWGDELPWSGNEYRNNKGRLRCAVDERFNEIAESTNSATSGSFCMKCGAWRGELGQEPSMGAFIKHLCDIFDEVRRVLKSTGTCWVVIGDTYISSGATRHLGYHDPKYPEGRNVTQPEPSGLPQIVPSKCLAMIPARFAIEMCSRGWVLRNSITWVKPNVLPNSASNRFTVDSENVFFFAKSNNPLYWTNVKTGVLTQRKPPSVNGVENIDWTWCVCPTCNGAGTCKSKKCVGGKIRKTLWRGHDYFFEQQFEPLSDVILNDKRFQRIKNGEQLDHNPWKEYPDDVQHPCSTQERIFKSLNPLGRNQRTTLTIPTQPLRDAHFAAFPLRLIRLPMNAGCPKYVCERCGVPLPKIMRKLKHAYARCDCSVETIPGVVLDPFIGSGTVGMVALEQGKNYVGIELNAEYIEIANRRIANHVKELPKNSCLFKEK